MSSSLSNLRSKQLPYIRVKEEQTTMSLTNSPYQVLENALHRYAQNRISDQELLLIVEGQGRLVESWIAELKSVRENRYQALRQYQDKCLQGYRTLLQGLKDAYRAIVRRDRVALREARDVLCDGQDFMLATIAA